MIICITASGDSVESNLDPRFGRCAYFVLADLEKNTQTIIKNEAGETGGGAGITSGQLMVEKNVEAVITGNVGPNAMNVLKAAGIDVYRGVNSTIKENIAQFQQAKLEKITATVESHFGMGGGNRS